MTADDRWADYRVPPSPCPWCGKVQDGAMSQDAPQAPEEGDFSVCLECGGVARFRADQTVEKCDEATWQAQPEPLPSFIRKARRAIIAVNSRPRAGAR